MSISLENSHILFEIGNFLPFKDLISLMSVSSKTYEIIQQYFEAFLQRNQAPREISFPKSKSHLQFAQSFCKKVLRFSLRPSHMSNEGFTFRSETRYLNKTLVDYKEVHQYSCLLLQDHRLLVEEHKLQPAKVPILSNKYCFENVKKFQINNKIMVFLGEGKSFWSVKLEGALQASPIKLSDLEAEPIDFLLDEKTLLIVAQGYNEDKKEVFEAFIIQIDDFVMGQQHVLYKKCVFPEKTKTITSFSLTEKKAYFVCDGKNLLEVDFSVKKYKCLPEKHNFFKDKSICKVFSGPKQTFAVEIKEKKAFCQFNSKDFVQMAERIGLEEYLNIFKYSKLTGKEIFANISSNVYLYKNFGLKNHGLIEALRKEISKLQLAEKEYIVWFWGDNSNKQFNFPKNTKKIIETPEVLQLPLGKSHSEIDKIIAFADMVYLLDGEGKIWATTPKEFSGNQKKASKEKWMKLWSSKKDKQDRKYFFIFPKISKHFSILVKKLYQFTTEKCVL